MSEYYSKSTKRSLTKFLLFSTWGFCQMSSSFSEGEIKTSIHNRRIIITLTQPSKYQPKEKKRNEIIFQFLLVFYCTQIEIETKIIKWKTFPLICLFSTICCYPSLLRTLHIYFFNSIYTPELPHKPTHTSKIFVMIFFFHLQKKPKKKNVLAIFGEYLLHLHVWKFLCV